jgi:hypothetical protein
VNREVLTGNVLILAMISPLPRAPTLAPASPLEQGAIDYRHLATVDELTAALAFHVTQWCASPKTRKRCQSIGDRVTRLWTSSSRAPGRGELDRCALPTTGRCGQTRGDGEAAHEARPQR